MLIFMFGIWMNTANVTYLKDCTVFKSCCVVNFSYGANVIVDATCDNVANRINQKESTHDRQ